MSRQAPWMALTMMTAESASVPSQSNTSKRKWRGLGSLMRAIQRGKKTLQLRRQGRLQPYRCAVVRMLECDGARMQKHALQSTLGERFVPCEIAVFVVTRNGKFEMRQMHANLMRAPGLQLRCDRARFV